MVPWDLSLALPSVFQTLMVSWQKCSPERCINSKTGVSTGIETRAIEECRDSIAEQQRMSGSYSIVLESSRSCDSKIESSCGKSNGFSCSLSISFGSDFKTFFS